MENMVVRTPTITAMLGLKGARFGFGGGGGGGGLDMEEFDGFLMGSSAIAMKEKESKKDDERRRREAVWEKPMFAVWVPGIVKGNGEI